MLPAVNHRPPFNITRASHIVLNVSDLAKSRAFYVDIVGLVVTEETADTCYLRGLSEACHHSLVLVQADKGAPSASALVFAFSSKKTSTSPTSSSRKKAFPPNGSKSRIREERCTCPTHSARR